MSYNPFKMRRCVRREFVAPSGQVFFKTKSFTRGQDSTLWHPAVNVEGGHVYCDCPDFRFRCWEFEPTVETPQHWCKHLARAVRNCRRRGELPKLRHRHNGQQPGVPA